MKLLPIASSLVAGLLVASSAFAQETPNHPPPLPPPNNPPPVAQPQPAPAPAQPGPAQPAPAQPAPGQAAPAQESGEGEERGHTGFQMALHTGVAIPVGDLGKDLAMSDVFGPQVPLVVHLGGKPIPNLYIGGFIGFGFGGAGGKLADNCSKANAGCVAASFGLGVEIQYHILPAEKTNPWIGYGIGISGSGVSGSANGTTVTESVTGVDFAHIMGGVDFRLSRVIGIGPMLDFTAGTYNHVKVEGVGNNVDADIDSDQRTTHFWITLGGRLVIFP